MYQKDHVATAVATNAEKCQVANMMGLPCNLATGVMDTPDQAIAAAAAAPVTTVVTSVNDLVKPLANPCSVNLSNTMLTMKDVQEEYPAFKWGNSEPWTAEAMQCWAWLATQSGEAHPGRAFSKQYGYEPYLV